MLPGDTPLLRPQTLAALVRAHRAEDAGATLLTAVVENPTGYGRVVHGKDGDVARVVEEADATDEERVIDEVNTSIYCFRRSILAPTLRRLSPANAQGEYYLTDAVGVLHERRLRGALAGRCPTPWRRPGSTTGPSWRWPRPSCATASTSAGCGAASPCGTPSAPTSTPRSQLERRRRRSCPG